MKEILLILKLNRVIDEREFKGLYEKKKNYETKEKKYFLII